MFEPQFRYTSKIVNELASIERIYGQLVSENIMPSLALQLAQENKMLATHHSTSIEGNPLTPADVTNIILGDQIPATKSEKEVKNYFSVLNFLFVLVKKREPITITLTKDLHKRLMHSLADRDLGQFRDGHVFVGHKTKVELVVKHNPPFHAREDIVKALESLYDWLQRENDIHPLLKAGILHHQLAFVHPFFDGNGRLARLLTTYFLLLRNYQVANYFILDDYYDIDRSLYSDTLHTADEGDRTEWLEYFLEGIAYSLQSAFSRIKDLSEKRVDEVTGEKRVLVTPREEEVIRIILEKKAIKTSDIQEALVVTRQQAHSLLYSLVKKGLLEKYGKTKTSYYKLKS